LVPNDAFVLKAWAERYPDSEKKILYLADGTLEYTKKLGFEVDLSRNGLGPRLRRFSLLAEDGVIKELNLEEGGALTSSGAEGICSRLKMAGQ
jgi:peroxiredoxin